MIGLALAVVLSGVVMSNLAHAEEGYGTISGRIVLDGEVPKPKVLIAQGMQVKDAAVCAVKELQSDSLVVDPKSKGIANIFIYLSKAPENIHPSLKETPATKKTLVQDQVACKFIPHAMFVRVDQTVNVKTSDACAHNFHTYPLKNEPQNFILPANAPVAVPVKNELSELLPYSVKCDIHPWMKAYWLVLDHPYAVVTSADGTFKIENLPAGEHEFRVWQERSGYLGLGTRRGFKVTVESGKETKLDFKAPLDKFKDEE